MRKTSRDGTQNGDAMCREIPGCARRDPANHGDQRAGQLRNISAEKQDARHNQDGQTERGPVYLREPAYDLDQLQNCPAGVDRQAHHLAQHRNPDLKAHARKKAGEDGLRKEVGQETEFRDSRDEQHSRGEQRHYCGESDVRRAARRGQRR